MKEQKERTPCFCKAPFCYGSGSVLAVCFHVGNNVGDSDKLVNVLVFDLNTEFILAEHNEICKLDGVIMMLLV